MLELNITIEGSTTDDLLLALGEAKRSIEAGNVEGKDTSDNSEYSFNIKQEAFNYG